MAKDLVCNAEVELQNPLGGKVEHEGVTYYFCSETCRESFESEPERFISPLNIGPFMMGM